MANTTDISEEKFCVNYFLQGLVRYSHFSQRAISLMLNSPPATFKDTQHRLEQYESTLIQQEHTYETGQFIRHTSMGPTLYISVPRGRGRGTGRYGSFKKPSIRSSIDESNKKMNLLYSTRPRRGQWGSAAKQSTSNTDAFSAKLLQTMQAIEALPPRQQAGIKTQRTYTLDSVGHPTIIYHSNPHQTELPTHISTHTAISTIYATSK